MSTLTLTKDSQGVVVSAAIDSTVIDGFVSATQVLERGKLKAVLTINFDDVEVTDITAPALAAAFAAGTATNTTKATITGSAGAGNHFAYRVSNQEFTLANTGDVIEGATNYTSGNNISGVDPTTVKYVAVYELDSNNAVVKFAKHTLTASEINMSAPSLTATYAAGTASGTTKATITGSAGSGNHFAYKVASADFTTPDVGFVVTGTTNYTSGSDISGVDASTNKYLAIYELTSSNAVVKFTKHTVTAGEIAE